MSLFSKLGKADWSQLGQASLSLVTKLGEIVAPLPDDTDDPERESQSHVGISVSKEEDEEDSREFRRYRMANDLDVVGLHREEFSSPMRGNHEQNNIEPESPSSMVDVALDEDRTQRAVPQVIPADSSGSVEQGDYENRDGDIVPTESSQQSPSKAPVDYLAQSFVSLGTAAASSLAFLSNPELEERVSVKYREKLENELAQKDARLIEYEREIQTLRMQVSAAQESLSLELRQSEPAAAAGAAGSGSISARSDKERSLTSELDRMRREIEHLSNLRDEEAAHAEARIRVSINTTVAEQFNWYDYFPIYTLLSHCSFALV
jgi:hypothetical protein